MNDVINMKQNLLITKSGTIHLGEGDIAVGNVLTAGLLEKDYDFYIVPSHMTWEEFDEYKKMVESGDAINFIGHQSTADLLGMEANRVTLQAGSGATLIVAQYNGPRLNEGVTDLPEGAELLPIKWELKKKTRVFKLLSRLKVI